MRIPGKERVCVVLFQFYIFDAYFSVNDGLPLGFVEVFLVLSPRVTLVLTIFSQFPQTVCLQEIDFRGYLSEIGGYALTVPNIVVTHAPPLYLHKYIGTLYVRR